MANVSRLKYLVPAKLLQKRVTIHPKILLGVLFGGVILLVSMVFWCLHVIHQVTATTPHVLSQPVLVTKPIKSSPDATPNLLKPLGMLELCSNNTILNVVAHPDDDILFMSPDLVHDIARHRCIRSVYLTSGDAGQSYQYLRNRESGIQAAYAYMYDVHSQWLEETVTIDGHQVTEARLNPDLNVSLVFMRLPDGKPSGNGFSVNNNESLHYLHDGKISKIHTTDHTSSYTSSELVDTLLAIMNQDQPSEIHTLNPNNFNDGDHSDHHVTGYFTHLAWRNYAKISIIQSYKGYPIAELPPNITNQKDLATKEQTFQIYIQKDSKICIVRNCQVDNSYQRYIPRQYSTPH